MKTNIMIPTLRCHATPAGKLRHRLRFRTDAGPIWQWPRRHGGDRRLLAWLLLILLLLGVPSAEAGLDLAISHVKLDRTVLTPETPIAISFFLAADARVGVEILDPDHAVVRHLWHDQQRPAGTNRVVWDGRDDRGTVVPNEAYLLAITAVNATGQEATYTPALDSGGAPVDVAFDRIARTDSGYSMVLKLPQPARVSLRAGIHQGPLLKTILDWRPLPAGDHIINWDGRDETGRIDVMEQPNHHLYARGMGLPDDVMIMQQSSDNYPQYHRQLNLDAEAVARQALSVARIRTRALAASTGPISPQVLVSPAMETVPQFIVYGGADRTAGMADRGVVEVSGLFPLGIALTEASQAGADELRYETILFVDNQRFDEEENGYAPYTYMLDSTRLSNGEHQVSVNQVSLSGQAGAYTFTIRVNN